MKNSIKDITPVAVADVKEVKTASKNANFGADILDRMYGNKSAINLNLLGKDKKKDLKNAITDYLSAVVENSKDKNYIDFDLANKDIFKNMCYEVKMALDLPQNFKIDAKHLKRATTSALTYGGISNNKRDDTKAKEGGYKKSVSVFITAIAWSVQNKILAKNLVK